MCADKSLSGSCLPDSPSYWERNKPPFLPARSAPRTQPGHTGGLQTTQTGKSFPTPIPDPTTFLWPFAGQAAPGLQGREDRDHPSAIAPWPCPALGTAQHTAPGELGRSLSPLQVG